MGLLVAGVPLDPYLDQASQDGPGQHPHRGHHGQAGGRADLGHGLQQRVKPAAVRCVYKWILSHGQVDEVDPTVGQGPGQVDHLRPTLAVARRLGVVSAVEAEAAVVAAVGAGVEEAVEEDLIAEVALAHITGSRHKGG